jgi:hypothetical protein
MRVAVFAASVLLAGCVQEGIDDQESLPTPDRSHFRCEVMPVLAAKCSFMDCHGNGVRPLSLYAEQRYRLGISWDDYEEPLTDQELNANYRTVVGFLPRSPGDANLLADKPLDVRAGGLFHRGKDLYGIDDVFTFTEDPAYRALVDFANGATAAGDCIPAEVGL